MGRLVVTNFASATSRDKSLHLFLSFFCHVPRIGECRLSERANAAKFIDRSDIELADLPVGETELLKFWIPHEKCVSLSTSPLPSTKDSKGSDDTLTGLQPPFRLVSKAIEEGNKLVLTVTVSHFLDVTSTLTLCDRCLPTISWV